MTSNLESAVSPDRGIGFDVPKLTRSTLNDEVYDALKDALIQGKIAPGAIMTIRSLAAFLRHQHDARPGGAATPGG